MSEAVAELLEGYLALTDEEKNLFEASVQGELNPGSTPPHFSTRREMCCPWPAPSDKWPRRSC